MTTLNVPRVVSEGSLSKNCKMMFVVSVIIVGVILLMDIQSRYQDELYIPQYVKDNPVQMEYMTSDCINTNRENVPVMAKTIVLYNLNKMVIPVSQIIVIAEDTRIFYVSRSDSKITHPNKVGTTMRFELPNETKIKQVIIDINKFYNSRPNITTTQIEIMDKSNVVVWTNCDPLRVDNRYIYLYMVKPNIIYPIKSQKLVTGMSSSYTDIHENTLNNVLLKNTWV
jgi:hypothetical protein